MSDLDPFIHMDQMGEVEYAPGEPKGTPWHPHRGFETVTYMLDGTFQHQDSIGGGGLITNGDTVDDRRTGILHIERPPEQLVPSGGLFHGIQLWVNLPAADNGSSRATRASARTTSCSLTSPDGGALVRVIAGAVAGHAGPGATHTPISLVHATVEPGAELVLPGPRSQRARLCALGQRHRRSGGQAAPHRPAGGVRCRRRRWSPGPMQPRSRATRRSSCSILGGRPIGEPVDAHGPFVMNTRAEIIQAFEDFQAGKLGTVPADHIGSA